MSAVFRDTARRLALLALLGGAISACLGSAAAATRSAHGSSAGSLTVAGYDSPASLRRAATRLGARVVRRIPALRVAVLRTPPAAARMLEGLHGIRYAERPLDRYALADPAVVPAAIPGGAYEWQYGATRMPLVPAAVLQRASAVTIAVVDTGADVTAPDIAAKEPATWSVIGSSPDVTDAAGHGTFVSSLAAGSPTNNEGVAGFGGDARLLVIQAGDEGQLSDVDEAAALVYAVDHGARVINMSFGGAETSATEQAALAYAINHGALLVAAAGNSGGPDPQYPAASLQPVGSSGQGGTGLAVAATDRSGARAAFSTYGSFISLAAPGADVFGAISANADPFEWPHQSLPGSAAGLYGYASGTSFAAPEVAGAAALVWAANPLLTAPDVAAVLKQSASGHGNWNQETGYGVLDVAAAVARAQGLAVAPPMVALSGVREGTRVRLTWGAPAAVSYRLSVSRDGGEPKVLLGATTATSTSANLQAGHTYSFTVAATTAYGSTFSSRPYVVALQFSGVKLGLRAARPGGRKNRAVRLWALFKPANAAVGRGGRAIALESYTGRTWRRFASTRTTATGVALWRGKLRRGTYRLRARYAGAVDLAPATSAAITLRVR